MGRWDSVPWICLALKGITLWFFGGLQCLHGQIIDLRDLSVPEWMLEEEFRLGSISGEHDAFVRPVGVVIDDQGTLYVLDPGIPAVRAFSPDGRFVRQYGQRGEGPGEYLNPSTFGILGDTVWVGDARTGRITLYDRGDGTLEESFLVETGGGRRRQGIPLRLMGPDEFLVVEPPAPDFSSLGVGPIRFLQAIIETDRGGMRRDTLVTYTAEFPGIVTQGGGSGIFMYQPIRDGPQVSYRAERDVVLEVHRRAPISDAYAAFDLLVRSRDGDTLTHQTFHDLSIPLPGSIKDSLLTEARSRLTHAPPELQTVALRYLYLPDFQPPVGASVVVGKDSTYWVPREQFRPSGLEILVLNEDFHPIGRIRPPPNASGPVGPISRNQGWFIERDTLDIPFLVRYRISR